MPRIAAPLASAVALAGAALYAFALRENGDVLVVAGLDRVSTGVLGGALVGVVAGLLAHGLVRLALQVDTVAAFQALIVGFGAKAAGAVLPWAVLSYVPSVSPYAAPKAYLLAYAGVVLLVVGAGIIDNLHLSNEIALDAQERRGGAASGDSSSPSTPSGSSSPLESVS